MLKSLLRLKGYQALAREEKGVLLDFLCHAEGYCGAMFIDKSMTVPMSDDQLADLIGVPVEGWQNVKEKFIKAKILKQHGAGIICPILTATEACKLPSQDLEFAREVLGVWNAAGVQVHKVTDSLVAKVSKLLKKHSYTMEQLKDAISNYAVILKGDEYFWTKKWSLADFLSRGVDRFTSDQNPIETFRSLKADKKQANGRQSVLTAKKPVNEYDLSDL